ncbi:MAG: hypothetical protein R3F55_04225 [Alphaproteobacteria bacterium]
MRDVLAGGDAAHARCAAAAPDGRAQRALRARAAAMAAFLAFRRQDAATALRRMSAAVGFAPRDTETLEYVLLLSINLGNESAVQARALGLYLACARDALVFALRYLPLAVGLADRLGRPRLAGLMLRRWLRVKARMRFSADGRITVNAEEATLLATHAGDVAAVMDAARGTPLARQLLELADAGAQAAVA